MKPTLRDFEAAFEAAAAELSGGPAWFNKATVALSGLDPAEVMLIEPGPRLTRPARQSYRPGLYGADGRGRLTAVAFHDGMAQAMALTEGGADWNWPGASAAVAEALALASAFGGVAGPTLATARMLAAWAAAVPGAFNAPWSVLRSPSQDVGAEVALDLACAVQAVEALERFDPVYAGEDWVLFESGDQRRIRDAARAALGGRRLRFATSRFGSAAVTQSGAVMLCETRGHPRPPGPSR